MKKVILARTYRLEENSRMTVEKLTPLYNPENNSLEAQMVAWQEAEDAARSMIANGLDYHPTLLKKAVTRATDHHRLKKSSRPEDVAEYGDFMRKIEQRFVDGMDDTEIGTKEHSTMLAEIVAYVDGVRGVDYSLINEAYEEFVPRVHKEGAHIGWLAAVNRACLFIREDNGIPVDEKPAPRKTKPSTGILKKSQNNPEFVPASSEEKLTLTLEQLDDIGKLQPRECKVLRARLGLDGTESESSEQKREQTLRDIGEKIRERKDELTHRRYLPKYVRYTGLLGVFTGNAEKKPVELIEILCRQDIKEDAERNGLSPLNYVYEVLSNDLHWLTDTTQERRVDPLSPEGKKMNGLG